MKNHKWKIEAWNQPDGPGRGWEPCDGRRSDATFFVFHPDGSMAVREFKTKREAKAYILDQCTQRWQT